MEGLEGKGLEKVIYYECTASTRAHLCRHLSSAKSSPVEAPTKGGALEKPFSPTLYKPDENLSRSSDQQCPNKREQLAYYFRKENFYQLLQEKTSPFTKRKAIR